MSTSREILPTVLTFKWFLSRMCAVMAGKITPSTKMFTAKFTLVRFFTCMSSSVNYKITTSIKTLAAKFTQKSLVTSMYSMMF
jgi:hypothetical protein